MAHRGGTLRIVDIRPPAMDTEPPVGPVQLQADGLVAYRHVGGSAGGMLVADLATLSPASNRRRPEVHLPAAVWLALLD